MAEEDDVLDEADALEEAVTSDEGDGEELDPLAEEMQKMMEDEGGGGGGGMDLGGGGVPASIARLMDVNLSVTIELGRTRYTMERVLNLGEQSLVELDKQVGDPVDILVNGKIFARGEVVTVSENFGV
ncbi:FliM/FliN family flagellar motor switch protein, partial [bacterium]|nr:FliM/FliN family flagellar motor switch protein [bacterium]